MISHVFFDRGGVIIAPNRESILIPLAAKYQISEHTLKEKTRSIFSQFRDGDLSSLEFWQKIKSIFGEIFATDLLERWTEIHDRSYVRPEMIDLIVTLKEKGFFVACLTDTNDIHYHQNLYKWYLNFDDVIASNKIGCSKSDDVTNGTTNFFDHALSKYQIQWEQAIFVDDLQQNCKVASKLGITTIVYKDSAQVRSEIELLIQ
jgi:epoxide hydrolase-like predicted phosphatase